MSFSEKASTRGESTVSMPNDRSFVRTEKAMTER